MEKEKPNSLDRAIEQARQLNKEFDYSIDINDKRIKRYKGYASINVDLKHVGEFISLLLDIKNENLSNKISDKEITQLTERSLFISSIITYARCFAGTDGRGIKLNARDSIIDDEFKLLHEYLINMRNQYLAHAGISNSERLFASANFVVHDNKEATLRLSYEIFGQYSIDKKDLLTFLELVKYLIRWTISKRDEAADIYIQSLTLDEKNDLLVKAYDKKNQTNILE